MRRIILPEKGEPAANIPVDRLIGRAVVIDISAKAAVDPDYTLTPEDVTAWEAINGTIARGWIVLLRTGWSSPLARQACLPWR